MSPSDGQNELEYLVELAELIISHEEAASTAVPTTSAPSIRTARSLHPISAQHIPAHAIATHKRVEALQQSKAKVHDDPLAARYHDQYVGKIIFENDHEDQTTYEVVAIRWREGRRHEWVAECAIVTKTTEGKWATPPELLINATSSRPVRRQGALQDFTLADLTDPGNIIYGDCVDQHLAAHLAR